MNGHDSCVLVTGGFDPIHGGHIDYFQDAKLLSTYLIVGVNSDEWLRRRKVETSCRGNQGRES